MYPLKILESVWGAGLPPELSREMYSMWIFYAIGSSFFAGITAILAKCGIKKTDSDVATAIRTVVVLLFSWLMVLITGTWGGVTQIHGRTLLFLVLSGLATGASWLCYFHALQKGDINKVVPIDKSSTVLSILLALIFLCEGITGAKIVSAQSALNMMQFMYLWLPLIFDVLIMFILSRMNVEETNVKLKKEKGITVETAQQ